MCQPLRQFAVAQDVFIDSGIPIVILRSHGSLPYLIAPLEIENEKIGK